MSSDLTEFARRADEAESILNTLQAQIDYLSNISTLDQGQIKTETKTKVDEIEDLILKELDEEKSIDSRDFARKYNLTSNDVYGAIQALEGDEYVIKTPKQTQPKLIVSDEGLKVIQNGSPEFQLLNLLSNQSSSNTISSKCLKRSGILSNDDMFKVAKGKACRNKWIKIDKQQNITKLVDSAKDEVAEQLITIQSTNDISLVNKKVIKELKNRNLLKSHKEKYFIISRGESYSLQRREEIKDITLNVINKYMDINDIKQEEWNGPEIKEMNFNAKGQQLSHGSLHPLMKMRHEMRQILLDMGFEEMQTNRYVESSFWNFDTLFQPQQHPARDAHDTFFLDQPSQSIISNKLQSYMRKVKTTHEKGGYGSIGWRYDWKQQEAKKNLLRTHTTAVSSRTLFKLAQIKPFKPSKFFSIDRVFRNESIDPTHLAEFHQVEGFIADYDLTLGHLLGVIAEFFKRIGHPDVRFKPAYNPYTEPSMEIFGWSPQRNDWIEVGNSGIFRPEMLQPMGLPSNVKVIAWGLGLERPCMLATKTKDIRELFGPRVDINMVKTFPIVRYDTINHSKNDKKKIKGFKEN